MPATGDGLADGERDAVADGDGEADVGEAEGVADGDADDAAGLGGDGELDGAAVGSASPEQAARTTAPRTAATIRLFMEPPVRHAPRAVVPGGIVPDRGFSARRYGFRNHSV